MKKLLSLVITSSLLIGGNVVAKASDKNDSRDWKVAPNQTSTKTKYNSTNKPSIPIIVMYTNGNDGPDWE